MSTGRSLNSAIIRARRPNREYQGQEYDWIFIDEATQFSEREFRFLGGCLRGTNDIPKRFYVTCNPGGIGHRWVKRLFIDRAFVTGRANPEENENPEDYTFIFASVEDNVHLMKSSPAYLQMLSGLPENMRRAYRYGDWNALSGAYFPEFSEDRHVVRPFAIPDDWARYRAFDYGLDMLACLWVAIDDTGRCYVYREVKRPGLIVSEAARLILGLTLPGERVAVTFAPPDVWSRQKDTGRTMAELFMAGGVCRSSAPTATGCRGTCLSRSCSSTGLTAARASLFSTAAGSSSPTFRRYWPMRPIRAIARGSRTS